MKGGTRQELENDENIRPSEDIWVKVLDGQTHAKSLLSSELSQSRKQYHELLRAYQELQRTKQGSFEIEELFELN